MKHFIQRLSIAVVVVLLVGCGQHSDSPKSAASHGSNPVHPTELSATPERAGAAIEAASNESAVAFSPIATALAATSPVATPVNPKWVDGKNYQTIVPAQPTGSAPDKVDVIEVFWYGCPHCFHLDPVLESWSKKGKASYINFHRIPVMWNDVNRAHARLFYTLEALNKLETLHTLTFKEIHENRNFLAAQSASESESLQRAWLRKNGISDKEFDAAYHSFSLENSLRRADEFTRRFRVTGVPSFVVNGKYITDVAMAGGESQLIALLDDLSASEHKH
jgi:protein dithiol oxidoreductase (disulfide-forming)